MAKKKQEDAPKGSPAWMATFSDLMNLLLCFFVLLFSMSTVDAQKFEMVGFPAKQFQHFAIWRDNHWRGRIDFFGSKCIRDV